MKKLMLLLAIICSTPSMLGVKEKEETENDNFETYLPKNDFTKTYQKNKNTKPTPNSIGMISFFVNVIVGAATESLKASKSTRVGLFLAINIPLGIWYYKEYVGYELKKRDGKLEKDTAVFKPYSFSGHFIGMLLGGGLGTGLVKGLKEYQRYQAKQKLIEAKMALKKAQLNYKYSKN